MDAFTPTPPPEYELQKQKNLADRDEKFENLGLLKKVEACKRPKIPRRKKDIKKVDPTNLRMSERLKDKRQNPATKSGVQLAKLEEKAAFLQESLGNLPKDSNGAKGIKKKLNHMKKLIFKQKLADKAVSDQNEPAVSPSPSQSSTSETTCSPMQIDTVNSSPSAPYDTPVQQATTTPVGFGQKAACSSQSTGGIKVLPEMDMSSVSHDTTIVSDDFDFDLNEAPEVETSQNVAKSMPKSKLDKGKPSKPSFPCSLCKRVYQSQGRLNSHVKRVHEGKKQASKLPPAPKVKRKSLDFWKCPECDETPPTDRLICYCGWKRPVNSLESAQSKSNQCMQNQLPVILNKADRLEQLQKQLFAQMSTDKVFARMSAKSPEVSMFDPIPAQTNNNNDSSEMESFQRASSNDGMDSAEPSFTPGFERSSPDENQMQDSAVNTARGKTI